MRIIPIVLLILTLASGETFKEMGYKMEVKYPEKCKEWVIPYKLDGNCTPVLILHLMSGEANIGGFAATVPGMYNILLEREGTIKIKLCREEGKAYARIGENSEIACKRIPIVYAECEEKYEFAVGKKEKYVCTLENKGSLCTRVTVNPYSPEFGTFFPSKPIDICPGEKKKAILLLYASTASRVTDIGPICFMYSSAQFCTKRHPSKAVLTEENIEKKPEFGHHIKKSEEEHGKHGELLVVCGVLIFAAGIAIARRLRANENEGREEKKIKIS